MKDCSTILRTRIRERLNETFRYKGRKVLCYDADAVPIEAKAPYIIMGDFISTSVGVGTKENYEQDVSILIEAVTKYIDGVGGVRDASLIANQITERIITEPSGYMDLSPDFYIVTCELDSMSERSEQVADGKIIRKLVRIRFNIIEQ